MKRIIILVLTMSIIIGAITGCRESDKVSYNLSQEADNFNIVRQLTVINCIKGDVLFQMTGKLSIEVDSTSNQLEITVEDEYNNYQKHFIGLSDNVTYVVEDIRATEVNKSKYTLNYNPNMWIPIELDVID